MVDVGVGGCQVRLEVPQRFLPDVRRVADHRVEARLVAEGPALTVEEHLGELQLPVEEALLAGERFRSSSQPSNCGGA